MIRHTQLFRHRPEEQQIGDCWRTTIACLLDKHPSEVPHFLDGCWGDARQANANTRAWLATQGLSFVEVAYQACALESILASVSAINPDTYYLLGGNSRTGCGHSVIACNDQIVWDPSIDDAGIVGPMDDGFYWVTYLIPLLLMKRTTSSGACEGGSWISDSRVKRIPIADDERVIECAPPHAAPDAGVVDYD
ncbi:MAG TPA: hypothetical protein VGP22_04590 [Albitalea sp.]|jgi:hypothetical protein|nr:hypothetical protein [Albitalea sp.]